MIGAIKPDEGGSSVAAYKSGPMYGLFVKPFASTQHGVMVDKDETKFRMTTLQDTVGLSLFLSLSLSLSLSLVHH